MEENPNKRRKNNKNKSSNTEEELIVSDSTVRSEPPPSQGDGECGKYRHARRWPDDKHGRANHNHLTTTTGGAPVLRDKTTQKLRKYSGIAVTSFRNDFLPSRQNNIFYLFIARYRIGPDQSADLLFIHLIILLLSISVIAATQLIELYFRSLTKKKVLPLPVFRSQMMHLINLLRIFK